MCCGLGAHKCKRKTLFLGYTETQRKFGIHHFLGSTKQQTQLRTHQRLRSTLPSFSPSADHSSLRPCDPRAIPFFIMFRRASSLLGRPLLAARCRRFSTDLPAAPRADENFVEAWKKVAPNMDPPKTPLAFMNPRPATPSSLPTKLTVNFVLPYASELSGKEVSFNSSILTLIEFILWFSFSIALFLRN